MFRNTDTESLAHFPIILSIFFPPLTYSGDMNKWQSDSTWTHSHSAQCLAMLALLVLLLSSFIFRFLQLCKHKGFCWPLKNYMGLFWPPAHLYTWQRTLLMGELCLQLAEYGICCQWTGKVFPSTVVHPFIFYHYLLHHNYFASQNNQLDIDLNQPCEVKNGRWTQILSPIWYHDLDRWKVLNISSSSWGHFHCWPAVLECF